MNRQQILNQIQQSPQTYKQLCKGSYGLTTECFITRRYVNQLVSEREIHQIKLNGINQVLMFPCDKEYKIVIASIMKQFRHFYTPKITYVEDKYIEFSGYELIDDDWQPILDIKVFKDNIFKIF